MTTPTTQREADERALFEAWKGYPLPEFNDEGRFDEDWLHREFVAFKAGLARTAAPVAAPEAPTDERRNIAEVKRTSDMGLSLRFLSARSCSAFERYLASTGAALKAPLEDDPDSNAAFVEWRRDNFIGAAEKWIAWGAWRAALTQQSAAQRCPHCDDTGDVHRADGEYMGKCSCGAAQAVHAGADTGVSALKDVRGDVREMKSNLETFGPYSEEAARIAIDGALDIIDEHIASLAATEKGSPD